MEFKIFLEPIKKNRQQDLDARLAQMQAKKGIQRFSFYCSINKVAFLNKTSETDD